VRLFIAGDTHGNNSFWDWYLLPRAKLHAADRIVQCGDFGFWEHAPSGVEYLDLLEQSAAEADLTIYALHGNHDNWSLVMQRYGTDRDDEGFVRVRPHIRYIPQGHVWTWEGTRMRAFGGAYSIDKQWRLDLEAKRNRQALAVEEHRRSAGRKPKPVIDHTGTVWFPDEEMTDAEFTELMIADCQVLDVVFSHDRPRRAGCGLDLKNEPLCLPNQDRLDLALAAHRPQWWFHGHLHHSYKDRVDVGDTVTTIVGLACDDKAAMRFWRPWHSWCALDIVEGSPPTYYASHVLDEAVATKKARAAAHSTEGEH